MHTRPPMRRQRHPFARHAGPRAWRSLAAALLRLGRVVLPATFAVNAAAAQVAQGDSTWRDHNAAARAAYERKDYVTYRAQLLQLAAALSGHSLVLYKLAAAEALLGNDTAAIRRLRVYAATGLTAQAASDSDFRSLRGRADFDSVVAQLARNAQPVAASVLAFTLPDERLLPEDITYDAVERAFYVSSMLKRKIVRVDSGGTVRDFVEPGRDDIWSVLGVVVDPRRRLLWATTSTLERTRAYSAADSGRGALLAYDLATGRLVHRYDLPAISGHHELGEIAVGDSGDVYVSDGRVGVLYVLRRGATAVEPLLADGALVSPQGIAVRPDGRLFVADYVRGIALVDPATRVVSWLGHAHEVPLNGIDGLSLHGHTLIVVQNGTTPPRVLRLDLSDDLSRVTRSEVLEANTVSSSEPTHGVFVGGDFYYIANSGFDRIAPDGSVKPGVALEPAMIRRVCLPAAVPESAAVSFTRGVVFSIRGADTLRLDIARPARTSSRVPVVMLVHGGGWSGGDRSSRLGEQMQRLAGMGYGAVSVDYRLVSSGRNTFPAAAQDVACAARWLRARGAEHGLDGARIVAIGESSGGELAALLGSSADRADIANGCETSGPVQLRGVVSMYGALDLRQPVGPDPAVGRLVAAYLGSEPAALTDVARRASPAALVHPGMPPFLLVHGADDTSVSPTQSRAMRDALHDAGVPVTYIEVPGQAHGFPMLSDDPALRTSTCAVAAFLFRVLQ